MAQQNTNAKSVLIFDEHIEGVSKKGNDYSLIKLSNGLHTVAITTDLSKKDTATLKQMDKVSVELEVNPFDDYKAFKVVAIAPVKEQ